MCDLLVGATTLFPEKKLNYIFYKIVTVLQTPTRLSFLLVI